MKRHHHTSGNLGACAALAILLAAPANAQTEAEPESDAQPEESGTAQRDVFEAAYFARYTPRTALDMVTLLPGFDITGSEEGARGLGLADTNVILNGRRISGKAVDVYSALENIGADSVVRIELLDASAVSIPGLTGRVANVVYTQDGSLSGRFSYDPSFRRNTPANWWNGSASVNGKSGATEWSVGIRTNNRRSNLDGPEITASAAGIPLAIRDEFSEFSRDAPKLTATLSRSTQGGDVLNANLALEYIRSRNRITSDVFVGDERTAIEIVDLPENSWSAEIGGDYEFGLGTGRLKLIALGSLRDGDTGGTFASAMPGPPLSTSARNFARDFKEIEALLRAEYNWREPIGDLQISLEGAYNRLDSLAVSESVVNGVVSEDPVADDVVEEKRGEMLASLSRPLGSGLELQSTLGFEVSELVAGSDANASRAFFRPKGSISAGWTASDKLSLNLKLERSVDQLSFFDFLADVDLVNDSDRGANAQLVPPQRWTLSASGRWQPLPWITLNPEVSYIRFEDVIEAIPISPTEEARGNLDSASELRLGGKATIDFAGIGLPGARLDLSGTRAMSRLRDPLTGTRRPLNDALEYSYRIDFRHDIPGSDWAWGGELFRDQYTGTTRLAETFRLGQTKPFGGLFIEHKDIGGLTATVWLNNILDARSTFNGVDYVVRRDGPIAFTQSYSRRSGRFIQLNISGSF